MQDFGIKLIVFSNLSPVFKGGATTMVGVLALILVLWLMKKTGRPWEFGQKIFLALAVFIICFGLFILIFQPHWWDLPYKLPEMK